MDTANWARDQAYNKMKSWVSAFGPDIDGFVSENDDMAIGGHQALAEAGIDIPITGIDGIQDGLQGVLDGWLKATNLQNGILELAEGLAVTKLILDGEPYEKEYSYVMPPVADQATAQKYYDQVFGDNAEFLAALPALVDANVASGDLSTSSGRRRHASARGRQLTHIEHCWACRCSPGGPALQSEGSPPWTSLALTRTRADRQGGARHRCCGGIGRAIR